MCRGVISVALRMRIAEAQMPSSGLTLIGREVRLLVGDSWRTSVKPRDVGERLLLQEQETAGRRPAFNVIT